MLLMFLSLICITFFLNTVSVKAATYSWNVNTGDDENGVQYIYEIVTWNSKAADDIFDTKSAEDILGDGANIGAMQCRTLYDAESHSKGWYIDGYRWTGKWETYSEPKDVWVENKEEFEDIDPDEVEIYEDDDLVIYKDTEDWGDKIELDEFFDLILKLTMGVPTPVEDYLKSINWNVKDLSISGSKLTIKYDKEDSEFEDDVWIEYSWDNDGLYQGQKWTKDDTDKTVIFEIGIQKEIPGYDIPLFLGTIGASIFGLIVVIIRKKKVRVKLAK